MQVSAQHASHIFLVRPAHFGANPETASSNVFQSIMEQSESRKIAEQAQQEFDGLVAALEANHVSYQVFEDTDSPIKSDAVFPNNWLSTHADGTVILYPMMATNRRTERRPDIVSGLQTPGGYEVKQLVDLTHYEKQELYCEGTGSLCIDHANGVLYACLSARTHREVVMRVAEELEYDPLFFEAEAEGTAIYHTNVLLTISEHFAILCAEVITNEEKRQLVINTLEKGKRQVELITKEQMYHFAGNVFPVVNKKGRVRIMLSQQAYDGLTVEQRARWAAYGKLVPVAIPTIERYGGGSIRCMIAGVHLPKAEM